MGRNKGSARFFELLESRQMLAAHIVGSATVYPTIQEAVWAASAGATITVDAGTYPELVNIDKPLTLRGAQAGVDARSNARVSLAASAETIVTGFQYTDGKRSGGFYVNADGVTLDGFIVQGNTAYTGTCPAGVVMAPRVSGTRVLNNVIRNNVTGLYLTNYNGAKQCLIQGNLFLNNNNPGGDHTDRAIYSDGSVTGGNLTNVVIDNNAIVVNQIPSGGRLYEGGIALESRTDGTQSNITITNNVWDGVGKLLFFNVTGLTISRNVITHCLDQWSCGIRIEGGVHNASITYNTIYNNNGPAICSDSKGYQEDNSGIVINYNNFFNNNTSYGNKYSVAITSDHHSDIVDVRNNWWGNASGPSGQGPGTGDMIWGQGRYAQGPGSSWSLAAGTGIVFSPWSTAPNGSIASAYWGAVPTDGAAIQAEDYDHGGTGIGYADSTGGNALGKYRTAEGADIEATTDAGGGFSIGQAAAGEWLRYTVNFARAGSYDIDVRVANGQTTAGAFYVEVDGVNVSGTMSVAPTGGWQNWQTLSVRGINLAGGAHVVRLVMESNGNGGAVANFNWFRFTNTSAVTLPAAPSVLTATVGGPTSVALAWRDNSSDETGFIVERKTGATGTWGVIAVTNPNVTAYTDNSAAAGTTYVYRVRATGAGGESANTPEASATTPAFQPVTYLSDLPFAGTPVNGWGPVERDMNNGGSNAGDGSIITLNGTTYAKGLGVHAGSSIAFNLGGSYDTFLADVGIDDRVTGTSGTVAFQVWADGAKIYDSGTMTAATATKSIGVSVTGKQQLTLVVSDTGDGVDFDHADWGNARLVRGTVAAPAAPTALQAVAAPSPARVTLTWADAATTETGFKVERKTTATGVWEQVATVAANVTTYTDAPVAPATVYVYRVRATNAGGESAASNEATVTTPAAAGTTYVSDLPFVGTPINGWGPVERDMGNGGSGAGDGGVITLNGVTYAKGLGVHAGSEVTIALNGAYDTFLSDVGVDDRVGANGAVTFQVWADGVKIYDSGVMTGASATQSVNVSVAGRQQLKLIVLDGGDDSYDHADWAGARLVSGATPNPDPTPVLPAAPTTLAAAPLANGGVALTWVDTANNADGFRVQRSSDNVNFTQIGTTAAGVAAYTDAAPTLGQQWYYRVVAFNATGASAASNTVWLIPTGIIGPWANQDVGSVGVAGSATLSGGSYTVKGAGVDIAGRSDAFQFVYRPLTGNGTIIARVTGVQNTNSGAKAGIMIRESLAANSKHAGIFLTPAGTTNWVRRSSTNGTTSTSSASGSAAPYWLRLVRSGKTLTAYRSANGTSWTLVGSVNISMASTVYVGLAVTSKSEGVLNTSTFSDVSVS